MKRRIRAILLWLKYHRKKVLWAIVLILLVLVVVDIVWTYFALQNLAAYIVNLLTAFRTPGGQ